MSTKLEDVIRDAVMKNRYPLKEDDSLMVIVTIMNRLAEDHIAALNAALESERTICQETALAWRTDAEECAVRIVNAALATGRDAIAKGMDEGGSKVVAILREELEKARKHLAGQRVGIEAAVEVHKKLCKATLAANAVMLAAAVLLAVLL